jgi:hypothetical protein
MFKNQFYFSRLISVFFISFSCKVRRNKHTLNMWASEYRNTVSNLNRTDRARRAHLPTAAAHLPLSARFGLIGGGTKQARKPWKQSEVANRRAPVRMRRRRSTIPTISIGRTSRQRLKGTLPSPTTSRPCPARQRLPTRRRRRLRQRPGQASTAATPLASSSRLPLRSPLCKCLLSNLLSCIYLPI